MGCWSSARERSSFVRAPGARQALLNRTSIAALAFLLGGGVGVGAGWIGASPSEPAVAPPRAGTLAAPSTPTGTATASRPTQVAATVSATAPSEALRLALEAAPSLDSGPATGRITGRVIDEAGRPLAGARIKATPDANAPRPKQ